MQSESNEKLPSVEVAESGGMAHVILRTNFEEEARDDEGSAWVWTEYQFDVPAYDGMQADIEANLQAWVNYAQKVEEQREAESKRAAERAAALDAAPETASAVAQLEADVTYMAIMSGIDL